MYKENAPSDEQAHKNISRLIPVPKWPNYHPYPSVSGLRYLIFNEHTNGFSKVVVRIGSRVLIDEERFFEWARNQVEDI